MIFVQQRLHEIVSAFKCFFWLAIKLSVQGYRYLQTDLIDRLTVSFQDLMLGHPLSKWERLLRLKDLRHSDRWRNNSKSCRWSAYSEITTRSGSIFPRRFWTTYGNLLCLFLTAISQDRDRFFLHLVHFLQGLCQSGALTQLATGFGCFSKFAGWDLLPGWNSHLFVQSPRLADGALNPFLLLSHVFYLRSSSFCSCLYPSFYPCLSLAFWAV